MASNSKITLTIAGDASGVQRALKQTEVAGQQAGEAVSKSSKEAGEALEGMGRQARGTREILRGLGDASMLVGGQEGQMATQALFAASAFKDLARGSGELVKTLGFAKIAVGGVIAAIATGGAVVAAHIDHTSTMNEVQRTAADSAYYLADGLNFVTQGIPGLGGAMGWLKGKTDDWSKSAHGMASGADEASAAANRLMYQLINTGNAAAYSNAQVAAAQAKQSVYGPYKTGYKFDTNNPGYQELTYEAFMQGSKGPAAGGGGGGGTAAKASTAAADALKATLSKWQGIADSFSNIAKGIADSLGPKLVAGVASPLMLAKGTSVLDSLKKQLADTIHLKKDLAALSKAGLDSGLLEQLTAGGLDSLPAADEILAGGKSGVGAINKVAGKIGGNANSIAGADAARQFADSLKKPIKVTLSVGKGGDDVLDKWLQKALKTKGAKFYGLKAA